MNLNKSIEVFNPAKVTQPLHIIGCGSVGSCVAELLARFGLTNFVLWDMDTVESKNIANQMFFETSIGLNKTDALKTVLESVNPECRNVLTKPDGWHGEPLAGYVFLCVDNIELRQQLVKKNLYNNQIQAMFDVRTSLWDAQLYAADWGDPAAKRTLLDTMNFTHAEAAQEVPVSACGEVLGVAPTVRFAATVTVTNFQQFVTKNEIVPAMIVSPYHLKQGGVVTL